MWKKTKENKVIGMMHRKSPPYVSIYFIQNHHVNQIFLKGDVERTLLLFHRDEIVPYIRVTIITKDKYIIFAIT